MILSVHLLTGAALVLNIHNPFWGGVLAFFSHYLLDALPHREYKIHNIYQRQWKNSFFDFLKITLDLSFGILLIFLFAKNLFFASLGGFLGILVDGLTLLFFIFPKNILLEKHHRLHYEKTHIFRNKKIPLFLGIFSQILVSFIAIFFLLL